MSGMFTDRKLLIRKKAVSDRKSKYLFKKWLGEGGFINRHKLVSRSVAWAEVFVIFVSPFVLTYLDQLVFVSVGREQTD